MSLGWILILWVDCGMENTESADLLYLHKRIERTFLELGGAEGLSETVTIFVKVDDSSVEVHKHTHGGPYHKFVASWLFLVLLIFRLRHLGIKVVPPSFFGENVSRLNVEAP